MVRVSTGRRLTVLFVVLALIGAPALVLRAFCFGESCAQAGPAAAAVPFCPLPGWLRGQIALGFREGRSPEVLAATGAATHVMGAARTTWPSTSDVRRATSVPVWSLTANSSVAPEAVSAPSISR